MLATLRGQSRGRWTRCFRRQPSFARFWIASRREHHSASSETSATMPSKRWVLRTRGFAAHRGTRTVPWAAPTPESRSRDFPSASKTYPSLPRSRGTRGGRRRTVSTERRASRSPPWARLLVERGAVLDEDSARAASAARKGSRWQDRSHRRWSHRRYFRPSRSTIPLQSCCLSRPTRGPRHCSRRTRRPTPSKHRTLTDSDCRKASDQQMGTHGPSFLSSSSRLDARRRVLLAPRQLHDAC